MFLLNSCSIGSTVNEMAMSEGLVIEATNRNGTIKIESENNFTRNYSWGNKQKKVALHPRKERWYGSLGGYNPGGDNDIHVSVEEGQQHFCSESEALEWLDWQHDRMQYVYTPDGLVVGWYESQDPNSAQVALSANVWQLYVNGQKPVNLSGSQSKNIKTYFKPGSTKKSMPLSRFKPSQPQQIGQRIYSGKSIDYMADSATKCTTADIEKAIANGKLEKKGNYNYYYLLKDDFLWVKLDQTGRVVLFGK